MYVAREVFAQSIAGRLAFVPVPASKSEARIMSYIDAETSETRSSTTCVLRM